MDWAGVLNPTCETTIITNLLSREEAKSYKNFLGPKVVIEGLEMAKSQNP